MYSFHLAGKVLNGPKHAQSVDALVFIEDFDRLRSCS